MPTCNMPSEPASVASGSASITLADDHVHIHELSVNGALAALVQQAELEGRDLELVVRALDVGNNDHLLVALRAQSPTQPRRSSAVISENDPTPQRQPPRTARSASGWMSDSAPP
jgi:hypothetical protein